MNIVHYSKGFCSLEGSSDIRGLQIFYTGKIAIDSKVPDGYQIMLGEDQILIFSMTQQDIALTDLFEYRGQFTINSIIGADSLAQRVKVVPRANNDYADMLYTNVEDMTFNVEDMKYTDTSKSVIKKSYIKQDMIENLHTSNTDVNLYLRDGIEYNGLFHIHKKDQSCMTGATHDKNSKRLFIKHGKKLLKTENPKNIPQSNIYLKKQRSQNRPIKGKTATTTRKGGGSSSSGGGY